MYCYVFLLLCIYYYYPPLKKKILWGALFWIPSDIRPSVRPSEQISQRPLTISLQNFTQARDGILPGN